MCAVVGILSENNASQLAYYALFSMQHRGQEATGISSSDNRENSFFKIKKQGLVTEVFNENSFTYLKGNIAIGHNRYSTAGVDSILDSQPITAKYKLGEISIVHNGNLINKEGIRKELINNGAIFQTNMDTENMIHLIARSKKNKVEDRIIEMLNIIKGAYSLIVQTSSSLIAVRDEYGIRPLSLGKLKDGGWIVASETCSFELLKAEFIRDIKAGEMIIIENNKKIISKQIFKSKYRPCAFEYIYFSRPDSVIDGKNIYQIRENMGAQLANESSQDFKSIDCVIPIPDSGISAAIGFANAINIPFEMGILRNHYIGRTFIEPTQKGRELKVKLKLSAIKKIIKGKRLAVIDDSLVRGTTSREIVKILKEAGAKEVHMKIASPEIKFPCYYGIDTPTQEELISAQYTPDEVAKIINADSLQFLSMKGLRKSLGENQKYSTPSFDGDYFI